MQRNRPLSASFSWRYSPACRPAFRIDQQS